MRLRESRQDHPPRARVNDARCRSNPRCLPSSKDRRPAAPFRVPGFGLRLLGDLAAAMRTIDAFSPPPTLSGPSGARLPSTRPVASGRRASLSLGVACRFLQPFIDARAHPTSVRPLAREWGFRPAARRHQPMRAALATAVRHRTGSLRATVRPRRLSLDAFHLRGQDRPWAGALEKKAGRAVFDDARVPSSWCSEHPGRQLGSSGGLEDLSSRRSGLGHPRMSPREGRHR